MTHRERLLTRYPEARCIRHLKEDGLTHYSVYSDDTFEPDATFLGTGWTEHLAWKDSAQREFPLLRVKGGPILMADDEAFDPELSRSVADMRIDADRRTLVIDYTDCKGLRSTRRVIPMSIRWGATGYHPVEQWLLEAFDRHKGAERTFALRDVHSWRELTKGEADHEPIASLDYSPLVNDWLDTMSNEEIADMLSYHRESMNFIPKDQDRLRRITEENIRFLERALEERRVD